MFICSRLSLTSGRDTTLTGAQASGERVKVDAGRNLTLISEQDSDRYDSKQQSASAGGSFTFGSMTGSASVNVSRDKMHSTWQSVAEQTGIFAGKGGFDVTVGEHTQLNGAVIASTADASLNRLDTGTLGFRDIENHADYEVEHQSAGMSTGGSVGGQFAGNMANGMLAGLNGSGSADSTTKAAVSEGTIVIRDKEKQAQDVAGLSRDAENANPGLEVIFDKEKEQNRLKAAQLIGEIGAQAGDIARTQGQIAGLKAQQDPKALAAAREDLTAKGKPNPTSDEIAKQAYDTAMKPFGTGSSLQQGISAVTAATPEIAAAAQAAIQACAGNVVMCLNNVGIQVSEAIVPGGVGAGGAVGISKTAAEATAAKAEAAAANAAMNIPSNVGKINTGKFGKIELNSLSKTGNNIYPAAKCGNFTVAGRALQKHGSREGSVYPTAKGIPAQINEQGQKILDDIVIVKAPGASVKEGNRFGGFDVIAPDGRGAIFDPQSNFRGFLEP